MTKKEMKQEIVKTMPIKFDALKVWEKSLGYTWLERRGKKYCGCCGREQSECDCKVKHHDLAPHQKTKTKAGYINNSIYYMTTSVVENHIVLRYFIIWLNEQIGCEHSPIKCYEVFRVAINEKGKTTFARLDTRSFMWNWDWVYDTEIKVRTYNERYNFNAYATGRNQKPKWLKYLDLNATKKINKEARKYCHSITPYELIKGYIENPTFIETMIKCKRYDLLAYRISHKRVKLDNELMMLLRKSRRIPNEQWADYIEGLRTLRKDTKNIKLIDPADFVEANKRVEKACSKIKRLNELERNIKEYNESYCNRVNKLVGVMFGNDKYIVSILPDVKAFYDEGTSMCHCVYRMGYYKHKDSYIFSVRNQENKRLETCEVATNNEGELYIRQCYGYGDKHTEHHKEIIQLMKSKLNNIKQLIL